MDFCKIFNFCFFFTQLSIKHEREKTKINKHSHLATVPCALPISVVLLRVLVLMQGLILYKKVHPKFTFCVVGSPFASVTIISMGLFSCTDDIWASIKLINYIFLTVSIEMFKVEAGGFNTSNYNIIIKPSMVFIVWNSDQQQFQR